MLLAITYDSIQIKYYSHNAIKALNNDIYSSCGSSELWNCASSIAVLLNLYDI